MWAGSAPALPPQLNLLSSPASFATCVGVGCLSRWKISRCCTAVGKLKVVA
ncbi:hypothetical protein HanPI659440_Chr00c11g0724211 [Helianthus annuus]|nr:hypothetical protein HanPI659440_Chr00c11g0724211 [Helianthus annuus]